MAGNLFVAREATIYGHLFENPYVGLKRGLFWNIRVELDPFEYDGKKWSSSLGCEWLTWPLRRLPDIDGVTLETVLDLNGVETTVHIVSSHEWLTATALTIRKKKVAGLYRLTIDGQAEIEIDEGTRIDGPFHIECDMRFEGIRIIPSNLSPVPKTPQELSEALSQVISLEGLTEPRPVKVGYIFELAGKAQS